MINENERSLPFTLKEYLEGLALDVATGAELPHYAAASAAKGLADNWTAALDDGHQLQDMVGDVDRVIDALQNFKANAQALAHGVGNAGPGFVQQLTFIRLASGFNSVSGVDAMVALQVRVQGVVDETRQDTLQRIERALTAWASETIEGRAAWDLSCEDFNVGDLLDHLQSPSLAAFLAAEGVLDIRNQEVHTGPDAFKFDHHLMSPDEQAESPAPAAGVA